MEFALFDLDDTLVDRQGAFARWADNFSAVKGLGQAGVDWFFANDGRGHFSRTDLFAMARLQFDLHQSLDDLLADYWAEYPSYFLPDEAVNRSLATLRAEGVTIGVITNGPPLQRRKAEEAGLVPLIDVLCISEEIGAMKPDPFIFEEAIRRCGGDPTALDGEWMVGDSAVPDIGGAAGVGLRTLWLHHDRPWDEAGLAPDAVVASVPEAVDVMRATRDSESRR